MNRDGVRYLLALAIGATLMATPAWPDKVAQPAPAPAGTWRLIGKTQADKSKDRDVIHVQGPYDSFRKIKFKVVDAPLSMHRLVVTYDNGTGERLDVKEDFPKGGESRAIDLKGVGTRHLRTVEFWYQSKGVWKGKADVILFGMK